MKFLELCLFTWPLGLMMGSFFACWAESKWGRVVAFILGTIITTLIAAGVFYLDCSSNKVKWNDGKCPCGGSYQFSNASNYHGSTYYYYSCDNCGNVIELTQQANFLE